MNVLEKTYPWYCLVSGDELQQGDILENCPVFSPPADLTLNSLEQEADFIWEQQDVVIISQSCDVVKGREKITEVLLVPMWNRSELPPGHLSTPKGMEEARRGQLPAYLVLEECKLPKAEREIRIVDFRYVYSLPLDFCRQFAANVPNRIRLLPPFREHLSQAFARFFMRVGLPTDIPPFR